MKIICFTQKSSVFFRLCIFSYIDFRLILKSFLKPHILKSGSVYTRLKKPLCRADSLVSCGWKDHSCKKYVLSQISGFLRTMPQAPSTRILIFLNPQLFLCGYGFRPHVSGESGRRICKNFFNPHSRVEIFEYAMNPESCGR